MSIQMTVILNMVYLVMFSCNTLSVDPENTGLVQKLISQRNSLIQAGLSYTGAGNSRNMTELRNITTSTEVSCIINLENWSKWLLGNPVSYSKYGSFLPGIEIDKVSEIDVKVSAFHPREVFPSHREVAIAVSNLDSSFTGTSGTFALQLGTQSVHLIVMWSVPYNLNIYNSYFGIGVVNLDTAFSRDMMPYWYRQMIGYKKGRLFQRGVGGEDIVFKHEDMFVIAKFEQGYHPVLNIR